MQDFQFLTVPLKGGSRTAVNLARVLHAPESDGHVAFLFDTGTTLITEQDYESFDLRFSTEIPALPQVPAGQAAHIQRAFSDAHKGPGYPKPVRIVGADLDEGVGSSDSWT